MNQVPSMKTRIVVAAAAVVGLVALGAPAATAATPQTPTAAQRVACTTALGSAITNAIAAAEDSGFDSNWVAEAQAAETAGHNAPCAPFSAQVDRHIVSADSYLDQGREAMSTNDLDDAYTLFLGAAYHYELAQANVQANTNF
jgi:hypothetical protein